MELIRLAPYLSRQQEQWLGTREYPYMGKKKRLQPQPQHPPLDGCAEALFSSLRNKLGGLRTSARAEELEVLDPIEHKCQSCADALKKTPESLAVVEKALETDIFLVTHGRFFKPSVRPKQFKKCKSGECFGNSQRLALGNDGLTYCEGLAVHEGISLVTQHGWCCTEDGSVVDVTWDQGIVYLGVPFRKQFVHSTVREESGYIPLLPRVLETGVPVATWKYET